MMFYDDLYDDLCHLTILVVFHFDQIALGVAGSKSTKPFSSTTFQPISTVRYACYFGSRILP